MVNSCRTYETKIKRKIQNYRKWEILLIYFNNSTISIFSTFLFFWGPGLFLLIGLFGAVRFHGHISIFEYSAFPAMVHNDIIIMALAITSASSVYETSCELLVSIKKSVMVCQRRKVVLKTIRGLKPFGVVVGSVKAMKRVFILKIIYFITDTLMTLLVTFPIENVFK